MNSRIAAVCLCVAAAVLAGAAPPATGDGEAIGSLKNARVAAPAPKEGEKLVFLSGPMPEERRAELARLAPSVEVVSGLNRESALKEAARANGVDARLLSAELIEKAPKLVWVHTPSAGVERFVAMKGIAENGKIVLTNSRAVHGPAIADHAFAMLLGLTRGLREYEEAQKKHEWSAESRGQATALKGKTMLVVGIGGIGSEIAERAHGFGMRVIATRRTDAPAAAYVEKVGKPGELIAMLPEADVVAICVPLTAETAGMFGKDAFQAMKKGSYLINIARGKIVDSGELVAALKSGKLAGACLDVTDPEPLAKESPLWEMGNVVITPHVAADAEVTSERGWELLKENVRRFGAGEPLLNVVDVKAGY